MKKLGVALVSVFVIAAIAWRLAQSDHKNLPASAPPSPAAQVSLPPVSVLAVRPSPASDSAATQHAQPTTSALKHPASDDLVQFRARTNYADLLARLNSHPDTPESLYLKAAIYARCATGDTHHGNPPPEMRAANRERFIASIAQDSKDHELRVEAYDRMNADPCAGLDLGNFDAGTLQQMLVAAADAGDVHAQAWLVADQVEHRTPDEIGKPTHGNTMNAADLDAIRDLLATGDADVIMYLRGTLASTLDHGEIRLDGESFDPMALYGALQLVACDAGANCGQDAPELLSNCAMHGRCDASNLYDYAYYYGNSPNASQLVDVYRQMLGQMILTGDFSGLTLSPIEPLHESTYQFGASRP